MAMSAMAPVMGFPGSFSAKTNHPFQAQNSSITGDNVPCGCWAGSKTSELEAAGCDGSHGKHPPVTAAYFRNLLSDFGQECERMCCYVEELEARVQRYGGPRVSGKRSAKSLPPQEYETQAQTRPFIPDMDVSAVPLHQNLDEAVKRASLDEVQTNDGEKGSRETFPVPTRRLDNTMDESTSWAAVIPGIVTGDAEFKSSPMASWEVSHSVASKHRRRIEKIASRTSTGGAVGQFAAPDEFRAGTSNMRSVVSSAAFDMSMGVIILANTMVTGLDAQYKGLELGHDLGIYHETAEDMMPGVSNVLVIAETVFGIIFTFELLVKMIALKSNFCRSKWNVIDFIIVVCWLFEWIVGAAFLVNPMFLRMMRVAKLARIVRMVKTIQAFDALQVLVGSIMASFSALIWSSMFLLIILVMEATLLCNIMQDAALHVSNEDTRAELFRYFGTFSRSMITMFEVTLGNWVPCTRTLMEGISEWYGAFLVAHVLFVGFAVVMVIRGVFLQQTFAVAASDEELMVVQKARASAKQQAQMKRLFEEFEVHDDEGKVTRERFRKALQNTKIRTWLSALELEVGDADLLFDCLDNGDECISLEKLMRGVPRLAGKSRSIDLVVLLHKTQLLEHRIGDLSKSVTRLSRNLLGDEQSFCSTSGVQKKKRLVGDSSGLEAMMSTRGSTTSICVD